jgi:hypothetical protein
LFPDGHLIDVNGSTDKEGRKNIEYNSTHRLALDEWFLVFPILIPSVKQLFVYLMSENAKWIGIHIYR